MSSSADLGKLISTHSTSPVFIQRAAIVALASFAFFLLMLAAFYARPQIGYFVLSMAFLFVDLLTLIGIWMQKRNAVQLFENGIRYRRTSLLFEDVKRIRLSQANGLTIDSLRGETIVIPNTIDGLEAITVRITTPPDYSSAENVTGITAGRVTKDIVDTNSSPN